MTIRKFRSGFTLVELSVVAAIFGILAIVSTNFLLSSISTSNRTATENEVRQNGVFVLDEIVREMRKASCVQISDNFATQTVTLYLSSGDDEICDDDDDVIEYVSDNLGVINKYVGLGPERKHLGSLGSANVAFMICDNKCVTDSSCRPGLSVYGADGKYDISLNVRPTTPTSRQDFCAAIELSETVTPRNM